MTNETQQAPSGACSHCGAPIPEGSRRKYCGDRCMWAAQQATARARNPEAYNAKRRDAYQADPEAGAARALQNHKKRREQAAKGSATGLVSVKRNMVTAAKYRAQKKNVPFNITIDDFELPTTCPVLGIELTVGNATALDNSPSLDRVVPSLGYIRGNVLVVSNRANRAKSDLAVHELRAVADFYENHMKENWMKP